MIKTSQKNMRRSRSGKKRSPKFSRKSLKGWKNRQPSKRNSAHNSRQKLYQKYGSRCFLEPKTLGFPVCDQKGRYDCGGIRAAKSRARGSKHRSTKQKAESLWRKGKCSKRSKTSKRRSGYGRKR